MQKSQPQKSSECSSYFNDVGMFDVFQRFGKKLKDIEGREYLFHYTDAGGLAERASAVTFGDL